MIVLCGDKIQNFVDLGCGNGLLVYILTSEGHNGLGIDVRARKIWKDYPNTTILKVNIYFKIISYYAVKNVLTVIILFLCKCKLMIFFR